MKTASTPINFDGSTLSYRRICAFFSLRTCFRLVLSFALLAACARPQSELATVFGTVIDQSGAVIPAAQISFVNQSTGLKRKAVTDTTGQYLHRLEPPTAVRANLDYSDALRVVRRDSLPLREGDDFRVHQNTPR
jgi:hypothetical protein